MSIDQSVPQHSECVLLHYQAVALLPFADDYRLITTGFSTVIFLQRAYTSSVHAHAGRTQGQVHSPFRLDLATAPPVLAAL